MNEHRGLQSAFSTDKLHKKYYNARKNKRDLSPKKKVSKMRLEKQNGSGDIPRKNPTSKASLSSPRTKGRGGDSNPQKSFMQEAIKSRKAEYESRQQQFATNQKANSINFKMHLNQTLQYLKGHGSLPSEAQKSNQKLVMNQKKDMMPLF